MKIKTLNQETIDKIAAGEVILRPASVVKELVENSIDAQANRITVKVSNGGKSKIEITDNGHGILYDDIPLAFKRHATSKISYLDDLDTLHTMGFRGEALSSIVAVSNVQITTRSDEEELGSQSIFEDGKLISRKVYPFEKGTEIIVSDIFKSVPARFKFLRKDTSEEGHIRRIIQKLALSHPNISFSYYSEDKKKFQTKGSGNLLEAAQAIYGFNFCEHLQEFYEESSPMRVYGLLGDLTTRRNYRDNQIFFLNGRYVKSKLLSETFEQEWAGKLMKHQHPTGIIFIELPPSMLDVNVHPQKTEIRILNETLVSLLFAQCIREAIAKLDLIPGLVEEETNPDEDQVLESYIEESKIVEEELNLEDQLQNEQISFENEITQKLPFFNTIETPPSITNVLTEDEWKDLNTLEEKPKTAPEPERVILEEKKEKRILDLSDYSLVGTLFQTYILLQGANDILLIDQHAAHEATLYETFLQALKKDSGFESQTLLFPVPVSATLIELEAFEKVKDQLEKFGFSATDNGGTLSVTAVPIILNQSQDPEIIIPLINYFSGQSYSDPEIGLADLITMACKKAVKAGDELSEEEIQSLLQRLANLDNPYTCPHGRPVIIKRSMYELEKLFKRVL